MSAKPPEQNQENGDNQSRRQNLSRQENQSNSRSQSRRVSQAGSRHQSRGTQNQPQNENSPGGLNQPSGLIDTDIPAAGVNDNEDIDQLIAEANDNENKSASQPTRGSKTAKSVAGSYADDEWSDFDLPQQSLTDRQYNPMAKRRYGRTKACGCYPTVSNGGQPSMIYEKLYCKHNQSTGNAHDQAKPFSNNWTNPGELPPIHKTDFVVKRQPQKPRKVPKYTLLMGYPTSMYGYNEPSKVTNEHKNATESQDADDESDYTDDSDAETVQEEEESESDTDEDANKHSGNRRDLYKQKLVKRTVVSSFSTQPRAVVSEYKTFLEEEGYLAGDEVYANYDFLEARMKKGRNLNGKLFNPVSGKMEYFDMKTEGLSWSFKKGLVDEAK